MSKLEFKISAFPTRVDNIDDKLHVTYSDGSTINKGIIPGYADKELIDPYIDDKGYLKWFYPDETEHGNFLVRIDTEVKIEISQVPSFGFYEGMTRTDHNDTYITMKANSVFLEDTYVPLILNRYHPDITSGIEFYVDGHGNKLTTSHPINNASYALINLADFTTNTRHYFPANNDYVYYQWEFTDVQYLTGLVASLWYSETSPWKFEISNDGIIWELVDEKPLKYDGNRHPTPGAIENALRNDLMGCGYYHHFPKAVTCKYLRLVGPQAGRSGQWRGAQIFVPITNLRNIAISMDYSKVFFDLDSFSTIESSDRVFLKENLVEKPSNAENAISLESRMLLEITQDKISKHMEPIVFDKQISNTIHGASNLFGGMVLPEGNYFARLTGTPSLDTSNPSAMLKGDPKYDNHYGIPCCFFDESTGLPTSEVKFLSVTNNALGMESIKQIVDWPDRNAYSTLFDTRNVGNTYVLAADHLIIELDYHRTITSFQFLSGYAYYQNILQLEVYTSDDGINWSLTTTCNYPAATRHNLSDIQEVNVRTKWIKIVPVNELDNRFGLTKIFIGTDELARSADETTFNFEVLSDRTVTFRNIHQADFNWKGCKLELYRTEFTNKAAAFLQNVNGNDEVLVEVNDSESSKSLNSGELIPFRQITENGIYDLPLKSLTGPTHWSWNSWSLPINYLKTTGSGPIGNSIYPQWRFYGLANKEAAEIITEYDEPYTFTHFMERIGDADRSANDLKYDYVVSISGNYWYFRAPTRIEIEGWNEETQLWEKIKSVGSGQKPHYTYNNSEALSDITEDINGEKRVGDQRTRVFDLGGTYTYKKVKYILHSNGSGAYMGMDIMGVGNLKENPPIKFKSPNDFQLWKMTKVNGATNGKLIIRKIEPDGTKVDMSDKEIYQDKYSSVDFIQFTETLPAGQYEITSLGYIDDSGWYVKGV